jgi:hypothetical protein
MGAKYPLMSMIKSVLFVTKASIDPPEPAGTIAALAVMAPVGAFSVDTTGSVSPAGHAVNQLSDPCGTTVKFSEYACAVEGTLQEPASKGNVRVCPALIVGPASGFEKERVSTNRHGVTG